MPGKSAAEKILAAIRAVPRGQVAGYGEIARRAGLPGRARLVARMLSGNEDPELPWHRILRSDGRIAFPPDHAQFAEQQQRLRIMNDMLDAARPMAMTTTTQTDRQIDR